MPTETKQPYTLNDEIDFGMYQDDHVNIRAIIDTDIEYLTWLVENGAIELDGDCYSYYMDVKEGC